MSKKVLSLFMAALMVFGGSLAAFAVIIDQDTGYPVVELVPDIDHTDDLGIDIFDKGETDNGFVKVEPHVGDQVLVTYHTGFTIKDAENNDVTGLLKFFYYKASTFVFKVTFSPSLAVGDSVIVDLGEAVNKGGQIFQPGVSHFITFAGGFEPPTEIYGLLSGVKYDEIGNPIIGKTFYFEIFNAEDDPEEDEPVALAYSDSLTGEMMFKLNGVGDYDNELELEPGNYKIYEVNLPPEYEFVKFVITTNAVPTEFNYNGAPFTVPESANSIVQFLAVNRMKDSSITAFKYDAAHEEDTPFADMMFEFELWIDDEEETEPLAIGQSQPDGSILFFKEWDEEGPIGDGVATLDLLYGSYLIKEVNIPESHKFVKYAIMIDEEETVWSDEEDPPIIEFMAGDVDNIIFKFYNIEKTSELRAFKFNAASTDENIPGFTDISFDFLVKNSDEEIVALGRSVMDGTGKVLFYTEWEMVEDVYVPIGEGVEVLVLPYGEYTIEELALMGYDYMGFMMYEDGELIVPDDPMLTVIPFMAGDVESFVFEFYNKKHIEYKEDTAYAFHGNMPGGTLNSVLKSKNWGWYINTPPAGAYKIYAGAAQNNISKGVYVGDVTFSIVNGKYAYTLDLKPGVEVVDGPHFGVYTAANKIPNGPGLYTNNITAASAKVLVLHLVVKYPME